MQSHIPRSGLSIRFLWQLNGSANSFCSRSCHLSLPANASDYHWGGASRITKSFQKRGLMDSSQQPRRVIGDEEAKVFPRPHGQTSSPESVVPNPCSSTHTHVVFSLELLLRPRKSPWLHLLVSIQNLFLFSVPFCLVSVFPSLSPAQVFLTPISATPCIKRETLGRREKGAEEDEVPNKGILWEEGAGKGAFQRRMGSMYVGGEGGNLGSRPLPTLAGSDALGKLLSLS